MQTPCANDLRFISDNPKIMQEASVLCGGCPVALECFELRAGTKEGVAGGYLPRHPVRRAIRNANDRSVNCAGGHPKALYEVVIPLTEMPAEEDGTVNYQPPMTIACTMCADLLRLLIDKADRA